MRIAPSLALILSLAACEHASTATSPSTLPEQQSDEAATTAANAPTVPAPTAPAPTARTTPAPTANATPAPTAPATRAPAAAIAKPTPITPAATQSPDVKTVKQPLAVDECVRYRITRAAPKWRPECEVPRVTKKAAPPATTATASPKAGTP